jgi:toxin ParE1/3/4
MRVIFTREASDDLEGILHYIATHNPAAGKSVASRIDQTLSIIGDFPRAGRLDAESGAREWVVPGLPLLIVYTVQSDFVEVVAVFHTSRDPATKRRPGR